MTIAILITLLLKHVAFLVAGAFVLLTISPVQELNFKEDTAANKLFLILFFGAFGILGTYSGNAIFDSIANLRAMAIITAGFFGGPLVGLGAGLIAGIHRFAIDPWGFSALSCSFATITEGLLAGLFHVRFPQYHLNWKTAFILALVGESYHMVVVLLGSPPFDQALALVKVIALPMIIGNSLGAGLFTHVIRTLYDFREKKVSGQAQKIFDIANKTVRHLRDGLNITTARATAEIIYKQLPVAAVAITNENIVLAHVGLGDDHHLVGGPIVTKSTRKVIATGKTIFLRKRNHIGCSHATCPFYSAIIVPLQKGNRIVGTLKLYGSQNIALNSIQFEIAKGLTDLFSLQLELEDIQIKDRMLAHAEIRHLQAQINPHFLFNSLNTIASFCRTAPDKARDLILDLSFYMRKNLDSSRGFIRLEEEVEQIQSYLAIEKARFGARIQVDIEIAPHCNAWPIPSLIIQPLVENAIKHGIKDMEEGGYVGLTICEKEGLLSITVEDNGRGMSEDKLESLVHPNSLKPHTNGLGGIGLQNSKHRLEQIYGPEHSMHIISTPGQGTIIRFSIPELSEDALPAYSQEATLPPNASHPPSAATH